MGRELSFTVYGTPAPAGSKKAFVIKGKPVIVDASGAAGRQWRNAVQAAAIQATQEAGWRVTKVPLSFELTIELRRPQSHYNSKGTLRQQAPEWPTVRPDLTKLVRAIEDALTGIVWHDDAQIVTQRISKHYVMEGTGPRVVIRVQELSDGE
jgi:Holliday junction resolvase RusA-like endonuclease